MSGAGIAVYVSDSGTAVPGIVAVAAAVSAAAEDTAEVDTGKVAGVDTAESGTVAAESLAEPVFLEQLVAVAALPWLASVSF